MGSTRFLLARTRIRPRNRLSPFFALGGQRKSGRRTGGRRWCVSMTCRLLRSRLDTLPNNAWDKQIIVHKSDRIRFSNSFESKGFIGPCFGDAGNAIPEPQAGRERSLNLYRCRQMEAPSKPRSRSARLRVWAAAPLAAAGLAVAGCGGGGGGGSSPGGVTQPPPPFSCPSEEVPTSDRRCLSPQVFVTEAEGNHRDQFANKDDNFKRQWGLEAIRADYAYANLALQHGDNVRPGSGQTIGFIDSGVHAAHPMFHGKRVDKTRLLGAVDEDGTRLSHGTGVASVAAGGRAPSSSSLASLYPLGVAWGSDVAMFAIPTGTGGGTYRPESLATLQNEANDWVVMMNAVRNWRDGGRFLDFLNLSIGYSGIIDDYSKADLETHFRAAIDAFAQTGAARKTILVWAAGNAHGDPCDYVSTTCVADPGDPTKKFVNAVSVEVMPGLVSLFPELQGHSVAVVSVGNDLDDDYIVDDWKISDFSNRCGSAADYCIAAPGMWVRTAFFGPHPDTSLPSVGFVSRMGTSFAAPMVTGGLAVMKHFFRSQLSNTGLLDRMFRTANKTGDYADSSAYGQGLMDLGAATSPVGVMRVSNGRSVDGPGANLRCPDLGGESRSPI